MTFLVSVFVNFHNGGQCYWNPEYFKLHYEPLGSQQAIWHIKSPCQTWAGAFAIPLTPMNLEPFSTLLLIQTLFVHGEQAPDFANNFQAHVSSLAFPAEMTSPIMH